MKAKDLIISKVKIPDISSLKTGLNKCIFHADKTPSLEVRHKGEAFVCYGCGLKGDIFDFVSCQKFGESINKDSDRFKQVLTDLAEKSGVKLKSLSKEEIEKFREEKEEKTLIYEIHRAVAEHYNANIDTHKIGTQTIREFIKEKRGFSDKIIDSLKIGYAEENPSYIKDLIKKFGKDNLLKTGLFFPQREWVKPLFLGRIIYPYFYNGEIVRFIGRKTENTPKNNYESGKYKKQLSPSDKFPYVSKAVENKFFYGVDSVKGDILIITEGVTDCISLLQGGFSCISPVTVRFREEDYLQLFDYAKRVQKVFIINDNEENKAGEKGAIDTARYLFKNGISDIQLCELERPEGVEKVDLNDFLKNAENIESRVNGILSKGIHIIDRLIDRLSDNPLELDQEIDQILELLVNKGGAYVESIVKKISKKADITKKVVEEKLKAQKEKKNNIKKSNTTITRTTRPTITTKLKRLGERIDPAGSVINDIVIEPLGFNQYIYTADYGKKRDILIAVKEEESNNYYLEIDNKKYYFKGNPLSGQLPFQIPREESLICFFEGRYKVKPINLLFEEAIRYQKTLFELDKPEDHIIDILGCMQTWLRPVLNSVFHIGRDGTKGSGKTSMGEFTSLMSRHGKTAGNLSTATMGRSVERYQLSLHVDEIDQIKGDKREEIEGILRHSQRRDNPYSRCNKDTGDLEFYDTFNFHNYSFRTDTEDALKQRSYIVRTKPTKDHRLALLTSNKKPLGIPVFEAFFFWYLSNIAKIKSDLVVKVGQVGLVLWNPEGEQDFFSLFSKDSDQIDKARSNLWKGLTKAFSEEEISLLKQLVGRYAEIGYNLLFISKLLNLNILEYVKKAMLSKQSEESVPESVYYQEALEYLTDLWAIKDDTAHKVYKSKNGDQKKKLVKTHVLTKGDFAGRVYYPYNKSYTGFNNRLKENGINTIGMPRFKGILKDIGFKESFNLKNQKPLNRSLPQKCLIFSQDILERLKLSTDRIDLEIKEERLGSY